VESKIYIGNCSVHQDDHPPEFDFKPTYCWEGEIVGLNNTTILAKVYDSKLNQYSEVEIPILELKEYQRSGLEIGSLFYLFSGTYSKDLKDGFLFKYRKQQNNIESIDDFLDLLNQYDISKNLSKT